MIYNCDLKCRTELMNYADVCLLSRGSAARTDSPLVFSASKENGVMGENATSSNR